MQAKLIINQNVMKRMEQIPNRIIDLVMPRALAKVTNIVKTAMRAHILQYADGTESRKKQSEASRERFPEKMSNNIGAKTVEDRTGVAKVIGVTSKAGQVNFDHGSKAKTEGRLHKFWWRENGSNAEPRLRKQNHDIKIMVRNDVEARVRAVVRQEVDRAIVSGELVR